MGPAPKPADQRARRNASVAMTRLPAEGRKGRAPAWPLGADVGIETEIELTKLQIKGIRDEIEWATTSRDRSAQRRKLERATKQLAKLQAMKKASTAAERRIWTALWKTPQAVQWEKDGWVRDVALYARLQAKGEAGSLDDAKEARQWSDRLGLNDLAMLRLRWEIAEPAAAGTGDGPARRSKRNSSKYGDLKVVS
ncbi:MAG: hypothetical protein CMH83_19480 [Nocardioides sp.]|nr:hypothetical protein [Nocardioides sp.]